MVPIATTFITLISGPTATPPEMIPSSRPYVILLISLFCVVNSLTLLPQVPLIDERPSEKDEYAARAAKLMKAFPMIDGHNVPPDQDPKLISGFSYVAAVPEE